MHPLEKLDVTSKVAKRAQYEAFEFSLAPDGVVVRNCSHADPNEHKYLVTIEDDLPSACTCAADGRYDGACKHRVALAIRRPVLEAVRIRTQRIAADGGLPEPEPTGSETDPQPTGTNPNSQNEPESDECEDCREEFPCFECVLDGRRELHS